MSETSPTNSPRGTHLTGPSAGVGGADLKSHAPRSTSPSTAGLSLGRPASLRSQAGPWALGSWLTVGLGGFAAGTTGVDAALAPWVWILSGVVIGLPHGAGDAYDAPAPGRRRVRWLAAYAAVIAAVAWLAAAYPVAALGGFVMLTIWHFGAADAYDLNHAHLRVARHLAHGAGRPEPTLLRWLNGAARMAVFFGTTAVASPTTVAALGVAVGSVWPGAFAAVGLGIQGTDPLLPGQLSADAWSATLSADAVAEAGLALWVLGGGAWMVAQLWRLGGRPGAVGRVGRDFAETAGLVALAWWLDPVFVVGLYFLGWHATRHIARRMAEHRLTKALPRSIGPTLLALWRFHRETAWLWLPVWPAWVALIWMAGGTSAMADPMAWTAALLAWFLVLTPVHHVLNERRVAWA